MSEMNKCRGSIRAIEFGVLIVITAIVLLAIGYDEYSNCITNVCPKETKDKLVAGSVLMLFAFIIIFVSSVNAAYNGCFKTAIIGTLLSVLLV
jgi:hypothetical protein